MTVDIADRLRLDPGQRTLGQLLQDREAALHEILRLRKRLGPEFPAAHHRKTASERDSHSLTLSALTCPVSSAR